MKNYWSAQRTLQLLMRSMECVVTVKLEVRWQAEREGYTLPLRFFPFQPTASVYLQRLSLSPITFAADAAGQTA